MSQKVGRKLNVHHTREACNGPSRAGTIVSQSHSLTQAPHIKVYGLYSVEGQINWKIRFHPSILFLPPLSLKGLNGGATGLLPVLSKLSHLLLHILAAISKNMGKKRPAPVPSSCHSVVLGFGMVGSSAKHQLLFVRVCTRHGIASQADAVSAQLSQHHIQQLWKKKKKGKKVISSLLPIHEAIPIL